MEVRYKIQFRAKVKCQRFYPVLRYLTLLMWDDVNCGSLFVGESNRNLFKSVTENDDNGTNAVYSLP